MTDRELLEKAAKAAGMWPDAFALDDDDQPICNDVLGIYLAWGKGWWNPRSDDGDALRLAVELRIEISPCDGIVIVNYPCGPNRELFEIHAEIHADRNATTRHAIVRAAAAIGEGL